MKKGARFLSYMKARINGYDRIEASIDHESTIPDRLANPEKYARRNLKDPVVHAPSVTDQEVDSY